MLSFRRGPAAEVTGLEFSGWIPRTLPQLQNWATMTKDESATNDRVKALERKLRLQSRLLVTLLLVVATTFLFGAGPDSLSEIRAKRFSLVDDNGNPRAVLANHNGATIFSMADSRGIQKIRIAVQASGDPEITFLNDRQQALVKLTERKGSVQMRLTDAFSKYQIVLGQTEDQFGIDITSEYGTPALKLRNGVNQPQVAAIAREASGIVQVFAQNKTSAVSISGSDGSPGAVMTMRDNSRPLLLLNGSNMRKILLPDEPLPARSAAGPVQSE